MNAQRWVFGVGISVALLAAHPADATPVEVVTISPAQPDTTTPVSLLVTFFTPTSPPFLFAPTVVEIDGFSIDVELFIDSGVLQAVAHRTEQVDLGILPAGVYDFSVRFTHQFSPPDQLLVTGSFQVIPEPAPAALALVGLLMLAGARRRRAGRLFSGQRLELRRPPRPDRCPGSRRAQHDDPL